MPRMILPCLLPTSGRRCLTALALMAAVVSGAAQSTTLIVPPSVAGVTTAYGAGTFAQAGLRIS